MDLKKKREFFTSWFQYRNKRTKTGFIINDTDIEEISKQYAKYYNIDKVLDIYTKDEFKSGDDIFKKLQKDERVYEFDKLKPKTPLKYLKFIEDKFVAATNRKNPTRKINKQEYLKLVSDGNLKEIVQDPKIIQYYRETLNPIMIKDEGISTTKIDLDSDTTEFHLPGYNFLGKGTQLIERMKKGTIQGIPINNLDREALRHDILYISTDPKIRNYADNIFVKNVSKNKTWSSLVSKNAIKLKQIITGLNEIDNKKLLGEMSDIQKTKLKLSEAVFKTYINNVISQGYKEDNEGDYKKYDEIINTDLQKETSDLLYDKLIPGFEIIDKEDDLSKIKEFDEYLDNINERTTLDPLDSVEDIKNELDDEIKQTNQEIDEFEQIEGMVSPVLERQNAEIPIRRRIVPIEEVEVKQEVKEEVKQEVKEVKKQEVKTTPIILPKIAPSIKKNAGTTELKTDKKEEKVNEDELERHFITHTENNTFSKLKERENKLMYKNTNKTADKYDFLESGVKSFFQPKKNKLIVRFNNKF